MKCSWPCACITLLCGLSARSCSEKYLYLTDFWEVVAGWTLIFIVPFYIYFRDFVYIDYACTPILWCRQYYLHFDRRITWGLVRLSNWHSLNRACKWERQDSTPKCLTLEFFARLAEFKSLGCVAMGPHLLASTFCEGISSIEGEEELGISL